jgi:hypothetical protein
MGKMPTCRQHRISLISSYEEARSPSMTYKKHSSQSLDQVEIRLREAVARHKSGILHGSIRVEIAQGPVAHAERIRQKRRSHTVIIYEMAWLC